MQQPRQIVKRLARKAGYDVRKNLSRGFDPGSDIQEFLKGEVRPVILDVGSNTGQSLKAYRQLFPSSEIHCFEPSHTAFVELQQHGQKLPNVWLNHVAVGASPGSEQLFANDHSDMSSFLPLGKQGWGTVTTRTEVPVTSLDSYCAEVGIEQVDLLKSDTQGYELEVLKGANRLLEEGRIRLVYFEVTFSELYQGLPSFDVLYRFLVDRDMRFVALYNYMVHPEPLTGWCDALFCRTNAAG